MVGSKSSVSKPQAVDSLQLRQLLKPLCFNVRVRVLLLLFLLSCELRVVSCANTKDGLFSAEITTAGQGVRFARSDSSWTFVDSARNEKKV